MTRIGNLRRRLDLQKQSFTPDGEGGFVTNWISVAALWGEIMPASGAQAVSLDRRITHLVRIRNNPETEVKTGMQLVDGSRFFLVHHVAEFDNRGKWLEISVEEGGNLE